MGDGKYGVNRNDRERGYKYQALYAFQLGFRFQDVDNVLGYLNGKTFSLDRDSIWFVKDFEKGASEK